MDDGDNNIFSQTKNSVLHQIEEEGDFVLDNNPTSAEFKEVQTSYKGLLATLKNHTTRKELTKPSNQECIEQLEHTKALLPKIHGTALGTMDSEFIALSSGVCVDKMRALRESQPQALQPADLKHLILRLPSTLDSDLLREKTMRYWKGIQCPQHLLGLFADPTFSLKPGASRGRPPPPPPRNTAAIATLKSPTTSSMSQMADGIDETTLNITKMYKTILDLSACSSTGRAVVLLYKTICDPTSFAKTVENLFYVSFLVKDGKIAISSCQDGDGDGSDVMDYSISIVDDPAIEDEDAAEAAAAADEDKNQKIFPISYPLYRSWITKYYQTEHHHPTAQ